jgi:bacteriocin-like protein
MSDKSSDKTEKVETAVQPADSPMKPGKDASVELTEDELAKVAGGVIFPANVN